MKNRSTSAVTSSCRCSDPGAAARAAAYVSGVHVPLPSNTAHGSSDPPAGPAVQLGEKPLVTVAHAHPLGVGQDPVGLVQRRQRRARMPLLICRR